MSDAEMGAENKNEQEKVSVQDLQTKNTSLLADYAHEMHQFIRQKTYETQVQFDKTLVYLCGGAIALSYRLFANAGSELCIRLLFAALLCWGVCCVYALIDMMFLRWRFPLISYSYYKLYDAMNEQVRVVQEVVNLDKVLQEEFSKINKTPDITPEIFIEDRLTKKQGEELAKRHEAAKIQLDHTMGATISLLDDLNKQSNSFPTSNSFKLVVFVLGAVCFFVFTYFSHIDKAEQLSCVPETAPSNRPVMECKGSQVATNCVKSVQEKCETQTVDPKQASN